MTPADLTRAAEIEEALAEWFEQNHVHAKASRDLIWNCKARAAALRAMAGESG